MSVQSQIDRLNTIKERIRTNLVAQGVTVPEDTMLEVMAEKILSVAGGETVPDYWVTELQTKSDAIQRAMEVAGRNKSAFLWYTDAHWPLSAKKFTVLLRYLSEHTPMNKVNFGGDIVGDPNPHNHANTEYVYDWRSQIAGLPNHHSVWGNHDLNHRATNVKNMAYAQLLAQEESADMVIGGESYYYIDSPAEKTRYLYLSYITAGAEFSDSETAAEMVAQGKFLTDALASVEEGWHIVAIAHRWYQYTKDSNNQLVIEGGSVPFYEAEILRVFDAYNARATAHEAPNYIVATDFSNAKGKVEFCIGGHCHLDYDFTSDGGIPVIITASETNQERNTGETEDNGVVGTITESAVFGVVADYSDSENTKITVVGVGRGTSRVVRRTDIKPVSLSDITYSGDTTVGAALDAAKFSFTVNYSNGTTDTVHGAASVSPATIGMVGDNAVTITYTEAEVTVSGAATIVGTAAPMANLFDKNDPDVLLGGRINSSGNAVYQADGQLVTGWIEGKAGDVFTIKCDKPNTANNYVGATNCYNSGKVYISNLSTAHTTAVSMSDDGMTVVCTIPATLNGIDFSATAYVRICVAYTDIDSIVITKA